ncbi:hypothetical protein H0I76_08245 [Limibaculum sp. M0105]|uniref:Uncharacterized protein n=1 Tax=Thermohalobaculum xanthum TaxID=2753746 RepID=A0A8J7M608_9RHOB|nr:hypothetical protein [Thermohalobaculum xanthum]MBK0399176.1 hypothetical protein [Thermohalobaculum xanthum]
MIPIFYDSGNLAEKVIVALVCSISLVLFIISSAKRSRRAGSSVYRSPWKQAKTATPAEPRFKTAPAQTNGKTPKDGALCRLFGSWWLPPIPLVLWGLATILARSELLPKDQSCLFHGQAPCTSPLPPAREAGPAGFDVSVVYRAAGWVADLHFSVPLLCTGFLIILVAMVGTRRARIKVPRQYPENDLRVPREILDAGTPGFDDLVGMVGGDQRKAERLVQLEIARGAPGKAAAVQWAIERLRWERR